VRTDVADVLRRASAHVLVDDVTTPVLDDDATHHVFRVLRVRNGDAITVTDGAGRWRCCRAVDEAIVPVTDVADVARRPSPLTVAVCVPKQDRPEWIVQKLTEIGVDRIVWLHSERSVVRWDGERASRQLARHRRVAAEALQQSRGVWLPEIVGPAAAASMLPEVAIAEPGGRPIGSGDLAVAVGPEGGWTAGEVERAGDRVSIGPTVLRVETAAIAAAVQMATFGWASPTT
jgi:16S rRNA (uracil1498-N3)-methyltransferase